jgi:thioredoxin-related protein
MVLRIRLVVFTAVLLLGFSKGFGQGIKFITNLQSLEEFEIQIKKSKGNSLLIAYSSHCDVCGHMDTAVYKNKEVGKFYNKNFTVYKIDLETELANSFVAKYQIIGYPTYLFFNENGVVMHRQKGGFPVKEFLELGADALNPERQYLSASYKFQTGVRNKDFCKSLAESSKEMDNVELQRQCVMCYLEENPDWKSEESVKFIYEFVESIAEPHFQFLIRNRELFEQKLGAGKVSEKVDNIILRDIAEASFDQKTGVLDTSVIRSFAKQYLTDYEISKAIGLFQANEFIRRNDTVNYIASIIEYFKKFPSKNGYLLTNLSQAISELTDDPAALQEALKLALLSIEYMKNENCYLNAASIAMQLNDKQKAFEILQSGKDYAQKENKKFPTVSEFLIELKSTL